MVKVLHGEMEDGGGEFVEERLDRACAIVEWREMFLATKITHLCVSYSNHDLIMLETQPT